jgi:hypothetical protein
MSQETRGSPGTKAELKQHRQEKPVRRTSTAVRVQRMLLGLIAGVMLAVGLVIGSLSEMDAASREYFSGTLLKVGMVLGITWLAAPQLERLGWDKVRGNALIAIVIVLVLWAIRPRIGAWAGAILLIAGAFFSVLGWFRKQMGKS